jgi:hypothetical protein
MKYFYTLCITAFLLAPHFAYAAKLQLVQRSEVTSGALLFDVMIDTGGESINALAGDISLPSELLSVDSISTVGSVTPLWLTQPKVSNQKELDTRTRVAFEAVFPGGFTGVRSPYYDGTRAGKLFSVRLRPESEGEAVLLLENIDIRLNDGQATQVPQDPVVASISIPAVSTLPPLQHSSTVEHEISSDAIQTFITKDDGDTGNWVLMIHDETNSTTVKQYSVVESRTSNPQDIHFYEWKKITFPYKLEYQSRSYFIHIKAEYEDGSYSYTTLEPVQKNNDTSGISRILILIASALLFGYVLKQKYRTKK